MEDENGKLLAVINQKVTTLTKELEGARGEIKDLKNLLSDVAVLDTKMENFETDVERLEGRINSWSTINSLAAVVAGIVGFFTPTK